MPEAGVKTTAEHFDLKTCEGGYVELRQLSYDELLERRDNAMQILSKMGLKTPETQIKIANQTTAKFSFSRCIVDHNLTFDGKPIDFSKPEVALRQLDPKIGKEIENLIDDMNEEEEDEETFTIPVSSSSSGEQNKPSET